MELIKRVCHVARGKQRVASKQREAKMGKSATDRKMNLKFENLNESNVKDVMKLTQSICPITYPAQVFRQLVKSGFGRLVYCTDDTDRLVAAICCSLMPDHTDLYIVILGCLMAYRRQGIGCQLLAEAVDFARTVPSCERVFLHVQTSNLDAVRFYQASGFVIQNTVDNYYPTLTPSSAFLLHKILSRT